MDTKEWFTLAPFCLYQLLPFRNASLTTYHGGVAFVLRVSCVILTLAVVEVSYSSTLARQDTFCATLFRTGQIIDKAS